MKRRRMEGGREGGWREEEEAGGDITCDKRPTSR